MSLETLSSSRLREQDNSCRSLDEIHRDRKFALQTLFRGDFKRGNLIEALKTAEISKASKIGQGFEKLAKQWCPVQDKERVEMYSFLIAYTHSAADQETSPYRMLNSAILNFEQRVLMKFSLFLFGLLEGLRSLPYMQYSKLYRGIGREVKWESDDLRIFPTFTSTSRSLEVAEGFSKRNRKMDERRTIITAKGLFGYDISGYSLFPGEEEVLLEPFQQVYVEKVEEGDDVVMIDVVDRGDSEFLILGKIPRKYVVKSPESEILQEAIDHCRIAEIMKGDKKIEEARNEWEKAMGKYSELANIRKRVGCLNVGVGYLLGVGCDQDFEKALEWLKKVGEVKEEDVWMFRELSNREFFKGDIDMKCLLFRLILNNRFSFFLNNHLQQLFMLMKMSLIVWWKLKKYFPLLLKRCQVVSLLSQGIKN